jgi:hypothetical protein
MAHDPRCDGIATIAPAELRAEKLRALDTGDIFGATRERGNTLPFLVTSATETTVRARCMTSQFYVEFERHTGEGAHEYEEGVAVFRIVTLQPLPVEMHALMLAVDRRMRLGSNGTTNPLDEGDKQVLLFLGDHWAAHPI